MGTTLPLLGMHYTQATTVPTKVITTSASSLPMVTFSTTIAFSGTNTVRVTTPTGTIHFEGPQQLVPFS